MKSVLYFLLFHCLLLSTLGMIAACERGVDGAWQARFSEIRWVDYSPSTANPDQGVEATAESIRLDLQSLRRAGFTGLITYGSTGTLGKQLLDLAKEAGFQGMIIGIWDPKNKAEMDAAKQAAQSPLVLGICVGNEGLMGGRYTRDDLSAAIRDIRAATKKPVSTTETVDRYDDQLIEMVDWVFPNAHPYFSNVFAPEAAVNWTRNWFDKIRARTRQLILFKEVGLPTAGDPDHSVSEEAQCVYYDQLDKTAVRFAYFEAFDLLWKTKPPVEPHWGIFSADRTPKLLARHLTSGVDCVVSSPKVSTQGPQTPSPVKSPISGDRFYIYQDNTSQHFVPGDRMGDIGDIRMVEKFEHDCFAGTSCMQFEYSARGNAPHACDYPGVCGWAGISWQSPAHNRGQNPEGGHDLSRYTQHKFAARSEKPGTVEFMVGGTPGPHGDSLKDGRRFIADLNSNWKEYTIDLPQAELKYIIRGFSWSASRERNPTGIIFYLDEIRFETAHH